MKLAIPLHKAQRSILADTNKFKILVCSRRFGKSIFVRWLLILKALTYKPNKLGVKPALLLCAPTMSQCIQVHWEELLKQLDDPVLKPHIKRINHTNHRVDFTNNRPSILLRGLDKGGDRTRGISVAMIVIDECQDVSRQVYDLALGPTKMDADDPETFLVGTPKGRSGFLYDMWTKAAIPNNGMSRFHYTAYDNPKITPEAIEQQKAELTPRGFRQEILAMFEDPPGAIFDHLEDRHEIEVNPDPSSYDATYLGVDFGSMHPSLIVVGQRGYPASYTILDCWSPNPTQSIPYDVHKAKALEFALKYNVHSTWPDLYMPMHEHLIEELAQLGHPGLKNIDLEAPKLGVMESAELINRLFCKDRLFINKELRELTGYMRSYHRDKSPLGVFLDRPASGQFEHPIDALRYILARIEPTITFTSGLLNR